MTAKRILWTVVAIIVVVWIIYLGTSRYDAGRIGNGEVYSNDPPAARSKTVAAEPDSTAKNGQAIVYPAPSQTVAEATPDLYAQTAGGQTVQPGSASGAAGAMPATDSINPEPPNGMVFSGTGQYQLYRQGDITWRLDTKTGRTCIVFATDEEWKKPRVLKAGCGRT